MIAMHRISILASVFKEGRKDSQQNSGIRLLKEINHKISELTRDARLGCRTRKIHKAVLPSSLLPETR